jgi:hypothetical protein
MSARRDCREEPQGSTAEFGLWPKRIAHTCEIFGGPTIFRKPQPTRCNGLLHEKEEVVQEEFRADGLESNAGEGSPERRGGAKESGGEPSPSSGQSQPALADRPLHVHAQAEGLRHFAYRVNDLLTTLGIVEK